MLSQAEKSPQKEHYWLARPVHKTLQLVQVKCTKGRLTFFSWERLAKSALQGINYYMIFLDAVRVSALLRYLKISCNSDSEPAVHETSAVAVVKTCGC